MKLLCSLSCNLAALCLVLLILEALAGDVPTGSPSQIAAAGLTTGFVFVAALYWER